MTMYDKGWLYGVWYCGTSWQKARLYGQYPGNYLKRVLSLFPDVPHDRLLQPCAGTVQGPGVTLDCSPVFSPQVLASVTDMPFNNGSFDLVVIDPPYSKADAQHYGVPLFSQRKGMAEIRRVLSVGGFMVWLDTKYPSYRRSEWNLVGLIGVITGFQRATRCCSIWERQ